MNTREILGYLGYRGGSADERTLFLIKRLVDELRGCASPKNVYGIWDCRVDADSVELGGMTIGSRDLTKHLKNCRRAALFATTLGTGPDTLIRRHSALDMEKAVVAQAVCAAMIDEYCDRLEEELEGLAKASGLYPTTRFSPGYGDFDLAYQREIVRLLNCDKRIGLTLTDGYMLAPSKSVTAAVGFREGK